MKLIRLVAVTVVVGGGVLLQERPQIFFIKRMQ